MKNVGIAIHIHDHGNDGYIFSYEGHQVPSQEKVAFQLGIKFDPDAGENLEVSVLYLPDAFQDSGIDREILKFVKH